MAVLRGEDKMSPKAALTEVIPTLQKGLRSPEILCERSLAPAMANVRRGVGLAVNSPKIRHEIDRYVEVAEGMLDAGAFVWHYERAGTEAEGLREAVEKCREIGDAYSRKLW